MDLDFIDKIYLGPMAGVTDLPFRLLCKEHGADVMVTEMISAKGLHYGSRKTALLLASSEEERPVGVQIFGSEPEIMAEEAARIVSGEVTDSVFDFVDINMGCPMPKIYNNGEGSALMKNPELVERIVSAVTSAVDVPVTVKIRSGVDSDHINAPEVARAAEAGGAAAVAVHARTRDQLYSGSADYSVIKAVKAAVKVPVIGNGDIRTADDVLRMKAETGCDSVMIARAAKGNPWIFAEIKAALRGEAVPTRPDTEDVKAMMLRHLELQLSVKGEYIGVREMRKHIAWYTEGLPGSAAVRRKVCEVDSAEELENIIRSIG